MALWVKVKRFSEVNEMEECGGRRNVDLPGAANWQVTERPMTSVCQVVVARQIIDGATLVRISEVPIIYNRAANDDVIILWWDDSNFSYKYWYVPLLSIRWYLALQPASQPASQTASQPTCRLNIEASSAIVVFLVTATGPLHCYSRVLEEIFFNSAIQWGEYINSKIRN